jgi:hypothetical protein
VTSVILLDFNEKNLFYSLCILFIFSCFDLVLLDPFFSRVSCFGAWRFCSAAEICLAYFAVGVPDSEFIFGTPSGLVSCEMQVLFYLLSCFPVISSSAF